MDEVIESCRLTFEEDGVEQATVDELKVVGTPTSLWLDFTTAIIMQKTSATALDCQVRVDVV